MWGTKNRESYLVPEFEREIYRSIEGVARELGCIVRAIGGMPNHVHLLLWLPTRLSVMELMKRVKGSSSAYINTLRNREPYFRWQEGYAVYGVSLEGLEAVTEYITNQKQRHASGSLISEWEDIDEEVESPEEQ